MTDPNLYVSNGTCYSAAGDKLDESFIPCGNDAFGHQTCCGAGDNCLADNACFGVHGSGYGSYLTYMAGCTDPEYKDGSCPDKHGIDQPWIALTLCDNSDGAWAPCSQEGNPSTLQPGSFCSCTDAAKTTVAFKDGTSIALLASLPQSTGQSIQFQAGHTPTAPASSDATATGAAPGPSSAGNSAASSQAGSIASSANATPTQTGSNGVSLSATGSRTGPNGTSAGAASTGTTSASDGGRGSSGLASGAKIGIGVGVALGVLLLLAALAFFLLRRRRRERSTRPLTPAIESHDPHEEEDKKSFKHITTPPVPEAAGQPVSEADGRVAPPWTMRSELEGTNFFAAANLRAQRESNPAQQRDNGAANGEQYVPYRPPQVAEVAELPAVRTPPEEGSRLG